MTTPFQQHVGMSCFQCQKAGLFTKDMQYFFLPRRYGSLAIFGQQTAMLSLTGRWQLTPRNLPQGVVIKLLQRLQFLLQRRSRVHDNQLPDLVLGIRDRQPAV